MNDRLTTEIKRAMRELVDAAPLPIEYRRLPKQPARRPRHAALPALVCLALVLGTIGVVVSRSGQPVSVSSDLAPAQPAEQLSAPTPTFVAPTTLPAALGLITAGRSTAPTADHGNELVIAGPANQSARLLWNSTTGACAARPATTLRSGGAPVGGEQVGGGPEQAAYSSTGTSGSLHWCDAAGAELTLITVGVDEFTARALARSVAPAAGDPTDRTLRTPPAGFVSGRPTRGSTTYALLYRAAGSLQLNVTMRSAWSKDMRLVKAATSATDAVDLQIAGRPAFASAMPGGARYQSVTILYDERTLVTLRGDGLSPQQLYDIAGSLAPADPSIAPDAASDVERCATLGLCG